MDIGCAYYVENFSNMDDYNHVLTQGPWLINDHYLTIRRWIPNFIVDDNSIRFLTVWLRILSLPVEYFDTTFLPKRGEKVDKIARVDKQTTTAERGNSFD